MSNSKQFNACSSGFGYKGSNGSLYLTTAWHCLYPGDRNFANANGAIRIGQVTSSIPDLDTSFINATAQGWSTANYIFNGNYPDATTAKIVVGYSQPGKDQLVSSSGAIFYQQCNEKISESFDTWSVTNKYTGEKHNLKGFRVYTTQGRTAIAAQGDSGGPVFYNTNSNTQALAVGTISASLDREGIGGGWNATCPSRITGSKCFYGYDAVSMSDIIANNHGHVNW